MRTHTQHHHPFLFGMNWNAANVAFTILLMLLFLIFLFLFLTLTAVPAQAQAPPGPQVSAQVAAGGSQGQLEGAPRQNGSKTGTKRW